MRKQFALLLTIRQKAISVAVGLKPQASGHCMQDSIVRCYFKIQQPMHVNHGIGSSKPVSVWIRERLPIMVC